MQTVQMCKTWIFNKMNYQLSHGCNVRYKQTRKSNGNQNPQLRRHHDHCESYKVLCGKIAFLCPDTLPLESNAFRVHA